VIDVKEGDTVMIVARQQATYRATVTKVGRVWVTVGEGWQVQRFRRDDQTDGSKIGCPQRFYTLDQWAERQERDAALAFLHEQGIDIRHGSPWRGREVDLAAAIRVAEPT
jgi:hypothetical protein